MTTTEITTAQIRALSRDAAEAGDLEMVRTCEIALIGSDRLRERALRVCARAIAAAKAMED
jgi:hypothetical protein